MRCQQFLSLLFSFSGWNSLTRADGIGILQEFDFSIFNCFKKLFQDDPLKRPSVAKILQDDFITQGYMPSRLPTSCLTMAPRFDTKHQQIKRGPLQEINKEIATSGRIRQIAVEDKKKS